MGSVLVMLFAMMRCWHRLTSDAGVPWERTVAVPVDGVVADVGASIVVVVGIVAVAVVVESVGPLRLL